MQGFVEVPRNRNNRDENRQIKEGAVPDRIESNPHVKSQKDLDARRTEKNNISYCGYKNHVKQDSGSKLIVSYSVTAANTHDSQAIDSLLTDSDSGESLYADSAYTGASCEAAISGVEAVNRVCEKGTRNHPLTDEQKENNRIKSKVRSRVEHIFGFMENSMNHMFIECIGIKRATGIIGLMNLTYNMFRKIQLMSV